MPRPLETRSPARSHRALLLLITLTLLMTSGCAKEENGAHRRLPKVEEIEGLPVIAQVGIIVVGTLISEDLTCVTVGMLIRKQQITWWAGGIGCFIGIYIGDLLFFLIGRVSGKGLMKMRFFTRGIGPERMAAFGAWFDRRPWAAIAMCRILPGLRVPLYLAVGAMTKRTAAFFWWTCFFAFVWTPALIALVAWLGDAFTQPFEHLTGGSNWKSIAMGTLVAYLGIRFIILMGTAGGRHKLANRFGFLSGGASTFQRTRRRCRRSSSHRTWRRRRGRRSSE
jgi:membrane protein DedA with SNARE-associated domain